MSGGAGVQPQIRERSDRTCPQALPVPYQPERSDRTLQKQKSTLQS